MVSILTRIRIRWTSQHILAALALGLGVLAIGGRPVPGPLVTLDGRELSALAAGDPDPVRPTELADWIVRGASDYRLVDLREPADYADYHLPGAESVPVSGLTESGLARNEKILLYSKDGVRAGQAWMLLKARGYQGVATLSGGIDAWKGEVLFPVAPANPDAQGAAEFERAAQLARFFGGQPRAAQAAGAASPTPQVSAPTLPKVAPPSPAAPKRAAPSGKKKEGC